MMFCVNLSVQLIYRHFLHQFLVATIIRSIVKYLPDLHKQLIKACGLKIIEECKLFYCLLSIISRRVKR